jgi:DNA-binding XRE family transcriptional regulator
MHTTALVREIDRLLRAGELSQRQIAARLKVSRGTISAIASGRRGLYGKDPFQKYSPLVPSSPPTRCPHCGYRVYLPCIICRIRQHRQRQRYLRLIATETRKRA